MDAFIAMWRDVGISAAMALAWPDVLYLCRGGLADVVRRERRRAQIAAACARIRA